MESTLYKNTTLKASGVLNGPVTLVYGLGGLTLILINKYIIDKIKTHKTNARAHFLTTGPEIYNDLDGNVDIFVAGAGTGGTITGVGAYLKSKNPQIQVVAVEPAGSPVLSGGRAGAHGLQGIGAGFIPEVLDTAVYDEVITVSDEAAYAAGREICVREGILVGISSGAALHAAVILAERPENAGKRIVVLLPDTGARYLSTPMFAE